MTTRLSRLLVVDDNDDNRYTLIRRLRREGYVDILTAGDGGEALEILRAQPVDLALLDIMMPQMNGYEVLERMKADAELRHVPVIMISAIEEMDSVIRCIELGAEDYLPKPFDATLLRARVGASLEKKRLRDEVRASLQRLEQEMQAARKLQVSMLPRSLPAFQPDLPVELAAHMEPAREVGGDLYDYFALGTRSLWFLVGDVAGKGASAAMHMARARSLVRLAAELSAALGRDPSPSAVAEVVNRELCRDNDERMFVTLFLGSLDLASGRLRYVNAGHPPPFRLAAEAALQRLDSAPEAPLGVRAGARYTDREAHLRPDEVLFLYSDGVTEADSGSGELFGEKRLERLLLRVQALAPAALLESVKSALSTYSAPEARSDDVTLLALRWRAPA